MENYIEMKLIDFTNENVRFFTYFLGYPLDNNK